jgi:uncharacterized protein YciI
MRYFALVYHVGADYLAHRGPYRAEHLALLWAAHRRGDVILAGALTAPVDAALFAWRCEDRAPIEAFVAADPYVRHGLVLRWEIRDWNVVVADRPMPA